MCVKLYNGNCITERIQIAELLYKIG